MPCSVTFSTGSVCMSQSVDSCCSGGGRDIVGPKAQDLSLIYSLFDVVGQAVEDAGSWDSHRGKTAEVLI